MYYFEEIAQVKDVLDYKSAETRDKAGVCALPVTASFQQLAEFLYDNRLGLAMLYDDEDETDNQKEIVGVVSERDVVRFLALYGQGVFEKPIRDMMSTDIESCFYRDYLKEAAAKMADKHLRHMIVTSEEGEVVGLISASDVQYFAGKG